jgi:superkiller protein 3
MELGASYLIQDRIQEAKEEFAKILAQDANNADAHVGMGMALANEKNHAAAVNEYKAALQTEPKLRGVNYRLGISQAELKQYDDAIASFLKERDASGDAPQLESALADAYQAKGMTQQAEEARNKAAQLGNGHE